MTTSELVLWGFWVFGGLPLQLHVLDRPWEPYLALIWATAKMGEGKQPKFLVNRLLAGHSSPECLCYVSGLPDNCCWGLFLQPACAAVLDNPSQLFSRDFCLCRVFYSCSCLLLQCTNSCSVLFFFPPPPKK